MRNSTSAARTAQSFASSSFRSAIDRSALALMSVTTESASVANPSEIRCSRSGRWRNSK
jgi:hypothetical protein